MPETAPKDRPSKPARDIERGNPSLAPLRVSYYRRMKPQRVYPWMVSWQRSAADRRGPDQDVTLRLVMAGAQVVPAEQTINAADSNARALFYVTPLAKGWLRAQRLEVLVGGRKVQEIPLASQVVSQRGTLVLLLLTFLLPWLIWHYIQSTSMLASKTIVEKEKPVQEGRESPISTVRTLQALPHKKAEALEKVIRELVPKVPALLDEDPPEPAPMPGDLEPETKDKAEPKSPKDQKPKGLKGNQPKGPKIPMGLKGPKGDMANMLKDDQGFVLKEDEPVEAKKAEKPQTWRSSIKATLEEDVPERLGKFLVDASEFSRELRLPSYVFLLFLLMTIASAWCCRTKRKNAYGKPIPLSISADPSSRDE